MTCYIYENTKAIPLLWNPNDTTDVLIRPFPQCESKTLTEIVHVSIFFYRLAKSKLLKHSKLVYCLWANDDSVKLTQ